MTGTTDSVDGILVLCIIIAAVLIVGAVSGALAVGYQRLDAWLDRQLAERHRQAREHFTDPILAAHRGRSTRLTRTSAPRRLEGPHR